MTNSTIKQKYNDSNYLPGGTTSITTGNWAGNLESHIQDFKNMGRWTGNSYRTATGKTLTAVTAYRVCKGVAKEDKAQSTYTQQYMMLKADGINEPDPRAQFVDDIITQFKSTCLDENNYFVLALDANETINYGTEGINKILKECNLVDMYSEIHDDFSQFPTHENGSEKIDYILCTRNLLPYITIMGYVKFNEALDTDHRAVYFDFSENILTDIVPISTKKYRMIGGNSTNLEGEKYIKWLDNHFKYHRIYEKVENVFNSAMTKSYDEKEHVMEEINKIDKIITEAMLCAEKRNCKKKLHALWSPKLYQSQLLVQFWNIKKKSSRQQIDSTTRLEQIQRNMKEETIISIKENTKSISKAFDAALKHHIELLRDHYNIRQEHLEDMVEDYNSRGDPSQATTIKELKHRERNRNDHKVIKRVFKEGNGKGITSLEIPSEDGEGYETITNPREIEYHLLIRNIMHFGQADDTPFGISPLKDILEYEGTNIMSQQLINNRTIPDELNNQPEYVKQLLEKLSDGNNLPTIDKDIKFEEFCSGLLKWKERTTTSPSGRHLGHYKVLLKIPIYDEVDNTCNISMKILDVYYKIFRATTELGETLTRWCSITTCMIEKIKNCPRIDKLRVIHLFEADYNLLLKIIWARKTVWQANDKNRLHPGQAGSRPGKKAIDVVLQKELKYLYARLTRTMLGTIDNDAKSCYDRIMCNLSMCVSQYYGVPINLCSVQAKTLKNSIFTLSTALGESNDKYRHSLITPIHGTGQGSCASPAIWLLISSLLMDILQSTTNGMNIIDINNKIMVKQWIEGFVDDTSIFTNIDFISQCVKTMQKTLEEDGVKWAGLLAASGGKLELQKCFYYILSWSWNSKGDATPQEIKEQGEEGVIYLDKESKIGVIQKEVFASHKTLGTYKCMNGNESDHYKYLYKKSEKFGYQAINGQLNKRQARMAYKTTYITSMLYSLPAMSLSEADTNTLQQPGIQSFLRIGGYEKNYPRAAVYAGPKFRGLGLPQLYAVCSGIKIESILGNVNAENDTGELIKVDLNWLQLNCGMGTKVLENKNEITYMNRNWITSVQEFLNKTKSTIDIKSAWVPTKSRIGDKIIMDEMIDIDHTKQDIRIFNNFRIYLKVITLSDLVNYSGTHIQKQYIDKNAMLAHTPKSDIKWPNQLLPSLYYFNTWMKGLESFIKFDKSTGKLYKPLGMWIVENKEISSC
jgi:Reverse transcriptase (RNA-dependent DNA polymerase)